MAMVMVTLRNLGGSVVITIPRKILNLALIQYDLRDNYLNIINYLELFAGFNRASRAGGWLKS
jgi:hypothetical protein